MQVCEIRKKLTSAAYKVVHHNCGQFTLGNPKKSKKSATGSIELVEPSWAFSAAIGQVLKAKHWVYFQWREIVHRGSRDELTKWLGVAPLAIKSVKSVLPSRLRTRSTVPLSASPLGPMILVAVSKVGRTILIFVEPGAKINRQYCRDLLLMQELIPTIRSIAGDMFVFKPAHRARHTVDLLRQGHTSSSVMTCGQPTVMI